MRRLAVATTCVVTATVCLGLSGAVALPSTAWRVTMTSRTSGTPNAIACDIGRGCLVVGALDPATVHSSFRQPYIRALTCAPSGCVGVGSRLATTLGAWRRTGVRWLGMPFHPVVTGLYQGSLISLACASSGDCLAVGDIDAHTHVDCAPNSVNPGVCETIVPVLERWDGSAWTQQSAVPVPVVANLAVPVGSQQGYSALDAVSCADARWCVAVGHVGSTSVGGPGLVLGPDFADTWSGAHWRMTILPTPGGTNPELASISCASSRLCVAVGSVRANGVPEPYAAEETDGVWSDVSPTIAGAALLSSVSCAPNGACAAVGYRGTGVGRRPLVERWQANRWTAETVQVPPGSRQHGGSLLLSVSCTAAPAGHHAPAGLGGCAAVGDYERQTRRLRLNVAWFVESLGPALPLQISS